MTPEQCREARKLLGWSRERLGAMSSTSAHFVRYYEEFGRAMRAQSAESPGSDRLGAVRATLEAAGVEFTNGDAPGVRLRKEER